MSLLGSSYLIPYVDDHSGPRRVLALDLSAHPGERTAPVAQVAVDGRWYVVVPGMVEFEVPADRSVHLSLRPVWGPRDQEISVLVRPEHKAVVRYTQPEDTGRALLSLVP